KRSNISSDSFAFCLHSFIFFSCSYALLLFSVISSCKCLRYAISFLFIIIPPILFVFKLYHDLQTYARVFLCFWEKFLVGEFWLTLVVRYGREICWKKCLTF